MTTDFRALCAELVKIWDDSVDCGEAIADLVCRARAALAEPQPEGPTDGQLWELYDQMDGIAEDWVWTCDYARAVLARWGNQP